MQPAIVKIASDDVDMRIVARAVSFLREGELLIYPTDTLYALGGMALDSGAVRRVFETKRRPASKPLPLIAFDAAQARSLCDAWPNAARELSRRFWPGPMTIVLIARNGLPPEIVGRNGTIAVRVPAADFARRLCREAGPLVSTSANQSGASPAVSFEAAWRAVGEHAAMAIDGGSAASRPSTIVDATCEPPRLIREGTIAWRSVKDVLDFR
ncbi:MAG: threonylcarbamoyl-AMP synthase [Vicinamibacteria bacterium]|nr:threonylcarbamoyl-AMP synthase [Vicinamibacteria bacterium]